MIDSIGVSWTDSGLAQTQVVFGADSGGGELNCPEHHSGGGEVKTAGSHNTEDFCAIESKVAGRLGNAEARDTSEAAGASHVVEPGAAVKVMATAGASANRRALAMATVGKNVTAGAND
ncbi:MAG: hypothetical protein WBS19_08495 [Candidatus Korobacteraceae bacterium]